MEYSILFTNKHHNRENKITFKKELLDYILQEYKKGHILSRREIESKFHLKLDGFFNNIDAVYSELGIKYHLSPNQEIKSQKANLLLKIILSNLSQLNLKLLSYRNVTDRGIDILCMDGEDLVGIELKAYKKEEKLKLKDIRQVENAIKKENLKRAILITTTDKSDAAFNLPKDISIINYQNLKELIQSQEQIQDIAFIRENSVNFISPYKEIKRQKILDYVYGKYIKENKKPSSAEISKNLHIKIQTYFKSLFEIYKILKVPPPTKNMGGKQAENPDKECIELWKNEFKKYILKIVEKENRYPSGVEIGANFGISHIWNFVKVSELYRELGLKPYLERETRPTSAPKSGF
ncbi:MAG: restriction endonuclease [Nanoarchaeota archaeon]